MKKTIQVAFFTVILLAVTNIFSQRPHHHPHHPPHANLIEKFKTELNLTAEQEAKLETLHKEFREEMHKNRGQFRGEEEKGFAENREKMHAKRKAHHEAILAILTDEQQEILKSKKQEFRQKKRDRMEKVDFKTMKRDAQAYREKNIEPIMLEQRAKLEAEISAEDKAKIAELRPAFQKMRAKKMALHEKMKEKDFSPELDEQRKTQFKEFREKYKSEHESLKSLVEKYDEEIEKLFAETTEQHEKWKNDLKEIHQKYLPKEAKNEHFRKQRNHSHFHGKLNHQKHLGMRKGHFLLLNPDKAENEVAAKVQNISNFPNPATNLNTLKYDLQSAGDIRIELRNEKGDVVKIIEDSFKEAGQYSIEVDLSEIRDGVYYYTILENGKVISEKVIKNGGR